MSGHESPGGSDYGSEVPDDLEVMSYVQYDDADSDDRINVAAL